MEAKEIARRVAGLPGISPALRWYGSRPGLSDDARHDFFVRVTKKLPAPSPTFTHRFPGGRPLTIVLDGIARELYWTGTYEIDALPLFVRYAEGARAVLDIGAADGLFSLFAAAADPDARFLAFEPGLRQLERFRRNVEANRAVVGDRIEIIDAALSTEDGVATFHDTPSEGDSSLNARHRAAGVPREVTVARGDTVVAERLGTTPVDLVKLDTESTEPDVLRGLDATIRRDRPVIFCEVLLNRTEAQLQELVDGWGYQTWWLGPDGPEHHDAIVGDPRYRYVNYLFLPDGREPLTS